MDGFCNGAKVADDLHELISEARVGVVARHHPPGRGTASRLSRVRRRPAASPAPATVGDPPRSLARAGEGSEKWAFCRGSIVVGAIFGLYVRQAEDKVQFTSLMFSSNFNT